MATPPFTIVTSVPGDSDIVSQYPISERGTRDIIQSWLLVNHDTNGNHKNLIMPYQSSTPATPSASLITVYADVNGRLKIVYSDGSVGFVGIPPGVIIHTSASSTPVGYLVADGSAVSRTTYADLFTAIGTTYGVGDGSTTFNLPDHKGRVQAGEDASGTRLSSTYFGATASLAAVSTGLSDHITLLTANLPAYTPTGTIAGTVSVNSDSAVKVGGGGPAFGGGTAASVLASITATLAATFTGAAQGGTSTPISIIQPTIIQRALIKT